MRALRILLILLFILPAFTAWMPHNSIHAFHDHQAKHHSAHQHSHSASGHDHDSDNKQAFHHPIQIDASTYFNEYLHVDLQTPEQIVLKSPVFDTQDIDFTFAKVADISLHEKLINVQSRAPPDMLRPWPSKTPLYLSTQRIRV